MLFSEHEDNCFPPSFLLSSTDSTTMNGKTAKEIAKVISTTVNLPKTNFPLRANLKDRNKKYLDSCSTDVYRWQYETRVQKGAKVFTLHDGPPYANGDLHMGHFLNKVCKDFINRYKLLQGFGIESHFGWDCHGLPIEQKALLKYNEVERDQLNPMDVRKTARNFALKTVSKHVKEMQTWGLLYDWSEKTYSQNYLTLDKSFEANEIELFRSLVRGGYVYQGYKPVYWSPVSRTALADSEIEYNDNHKSSAIYVGFSLLKSNSAAIQRLLDDKKNIQAVIYTTTPWTIPSNIAISIHPEFMYNIIQDDNNQDNYYLLESSLTPSVTQLLSIPYHVVATVQGRDLNYTQYEHPLFHSVHPLITGDHVKQDMGTGLIHTSPSHGEDDFNVCKQHHIIKLSNTSSSATPSSSGFLFDVVNDVDEKGFYTSVYGKQFEGKNVLKDANKFVMDLLKQSNHLLYQTTITHRYPYDWRAKTPVINRCTEQFFIHIDNNLKDLILQELKSVSFFPSVSYNRLSSMIENRPDWCISRQRRWGVPLPIFFQCDESTNTKKPILDDQLMSEVQSMIQQEGSDSWYRYSTTELLEKLPSLKQYNQQPHLKLVKSLDTLDVWFDSGSSWNSVLPQKKADVYFEGSDQHRGWFQSSTLLSVIYKLEKEKESSDSTLKTKDHTHLPFGTLITHGFINDETGRKMSKSLGNTILPKELIDTGIKINNKNEVLGTDIARLFAASCNYTNDFNVGSLQLSKVMEVYRRLRNSCRFLLGNLSGFEENQRLPYDQLSYIDKDILNKYYHLYTTILRSYDQYEFYNVYSALSSFVVRDLSSGYFDIIKDRLYTEPSTSPLVLSTKTSLSYILDQFPLLFAPIMPFLSQEIYESAYPDSKRSIFMNTYHSLPSEWNNKQIGDISNVVNSLKQEFNKCTEEMIQNKIIKTNLELDLSIQLSGQQSVIELLKSVSKRDYEDIFLCSHAGIVDQPVNSCLKSIPFSLSNYEIEGTLFISKSQHMKCQRCWKYNAEVSNSYTVDQENQFYFCDKCYSILQEKKVL